MRFSAINRIVSGSTISCYRGLLAGCTLCARPGYDRGKVKHHPYLLCVTGLKNSGKTTVCSKIIGGLTARGHQVAALKSSHVSALRLDHRATDSHALAESGARFVLVQAAEQSLIVERTRRSFAQMLECVPKDVRFVVSEGGDPSAADAVIVCLHDTGQLAETVRVRRIPHAKILAVAGPCAHPGAPESLREIPVFDIKKAVHTKCLLELLLRSAGEA